MLQNKKNNITPPTDKVIYGHSNATKRTAFFLQPPTTNEIEFTLK
jgi:hypothetical protein